MWKLSVIGQHHERPDMDAVFFRLIFQIWAEWGSCGDLAVLRCCCLAKAPMLAEVMEEMLAQLGAGVVMSEIIPEAEGRLLAAGFNRIDYLELRDGGDLALLDQAKPGARLFAEAWLAGMWLIDNTAV